MTNDLISQADALLGRFAALKEHAKLNPNAVIFEMIDIRGALIAMVPELVEEIKHMREEITELNELCNFKDERTEKWQKIAIDLKAISYFVNFHSREEVFGLQPTDIQDLYKTRAAKELSLQVAQDVGYLERLEAAFLDAKQGELYFREYSRRGDVELPDAYNRSKQEAQAALEKIREKR